MVRKISLASFQKDKDVIGPTRKYLFYVKVPFNYLSNPEQHFPSLGDNNSCNGTRGATSMMQNRTVV